MSSTTPQTINDPIVNNIIAKMTYVTPESKVKEAIGKVRFARTEMLRDFKFYSNLAIQMQLLPINNLGTCATDGKSFMFDPEFICGASDEYLSNMTFTYDLMLKDGQIDQAMYDDAIVRIKNFYKKKTTKELVFVMIHELRHMINEHIGRTNFGNLDHELSNIAQDYNINNRIMYEMYGADLTKAKKDIGMFDSMLFSDKYFTLEGGQYTEWFSEKIYYDLLEEQEKEGGSGNGNQEGKTSFDIHVEISEEQSANIKNQIIQASKMAGDTPNDIKQYVKTVTQTKISWSKVLDRDIKSMIVDDYSYERPHNSSWVLTDIARGLGTISQDEYMIRPSEHTEETVDVLCCMDTSGSISDDVLSKCLSETVGVVRQFSDARMKVLSWDTQVRNYVDYGIAEFSKLKNYQFGGRGGTEPSCIGAYIKNNKLTPTNVVIFTDMCFFSDSYVETLKGVKNVMFVAIDTDVKAKIGKTIKLSTRDM